MTDFDSVQRQLDTLREDIATRARRVRILGYALLGAGLILIAWAAWFIASQSQPDRTVEYVDVVTAFAVTHRGAPA